MTQPLHACACVHAECCPHVFACVHPFLIAHPNHLWKSPQERQTWGSQSSTGRKPWETTHLQNKTLLDFKFPELDKDTKPSWMFHINNWNNQVRGVFVWHDCWHLFKHRRKGHSMGFQHDSVSTWRGKCTTEQHVVRLKDVTLSLNNLSPQLQDSWCWQQTSKSTEWKLAKTSAQKKQHFGKGFWTSTSNCSKFKTIGFPGTCIKTTGMKAAMEEAIHHDMLCQHPSPGPRALLPKPKLNRVFLLRALGEIEWKLQLKRSSIMMRWPVSMLCWHPDPRALSPKPKLNWVFLLHAMMCPTKGPIEHHHFQKSQDSCVALDVSCPGGQNLLVVWLPPGVDPLLPRQTHYLTIEDKKQQQRASSDNNHHNTDMVFKNG